MTEMISPQHASPTRGVDEPRPKGRSKDADRDKDQDVEEG